MLKIKNSPIQKISWLNHDIFIKRDDLLHKNFSGNKARKLQYFFENFPTNIDKIISYGGNQSNAMYSISVFAKLKNVKFYYVTSKVSSFLKNNPIGNYQKSIQNGMIVFESKQKESFAKSLIDEKTLFIHEGVSDEMAQYGIKTLADEISQYAKQKKQTFDIFLTAGTGTTAYFLKQFLEFEVYTTPCVGDEEYLKLQFSKFGKNFPKILNTKENFTFAKPNIKLYQMYQKLLFDTKIEFDLIYDCKGFICLEENIKIFNNPIIYIHQGGTLANESQILRYKYLKLI